MSNLILREWNGQKIRQRADGFLSATDMCQAEGKLIGNWIQLKSTEEYLRALQEKLGISDRSQLIEVNQGGVPQYQGSWVDRRVAVRLAQWISPRFAIQVDEWVIELLTQKSNWQSELERSFLESLVFSVSPCKGAFVYAILDAGNDRVKIGMTANPIQRLKTLQAGDCTTLRFEGLRPVESVGLAKLHEGYLHSLFADDRICGEWFKASLMIDARFEDYFRGSDNFEGEIPPNAIESKVICSV